MSEVVTLHYGKALRENERIHGEIPVYGTNGITGWHNQALGSGPTVILGRKGMGNLGVEWCEGPFWVIDTAYFTTFDEEVLYPKYFFYFTNFVGLNHLKDGTSNPSLTREVFSRQLLPLPPLNQQRTIADILGALDDKIELNRRMNATLEATARALFQSWFVDFDPVRAKAEGRQPEGMDAETAALFPDAFEESALGLIPKGWSWGRVSDVCNSITSGGTPSTQNPDFWNGDIPWLSSGETRERFIITTEKTITPRGVEQSSTRLARAWTTVIASAGQGHTRGQTSLLLFDSYINQSVVGVKANYDILSDLYIFFDLSRRYEEMRRISDAHSSRGSLTTRLVGDMRVVVPTIEIIEVFDRFVVPIIESIASKMQESRTLAEMRDALLPKLISGEVRVGG